jgi:hypothetical protein
MPEEANMKKYAIQKTLWGLASLALIAALVVAVMPQRARAMDVRPNTSAVGADEVVNDDLLLSSDSVEMAGTVNGNLIIAGGDVTVSGTVHGDVITAGGIIHITGTVDGNLIAFCNTLQLDGTVTDGVFFGGYSERMGPQAKVGGNVYAGGYSVEIQPGAVVSRDAAVGAYQLILGGEVKRDINVGVSALKITGQVGRNATIDVGKPSDNAPEQVRMQFSGMPSGFAVDVTPIKPGLDVASSATIGGKLAYSSSVDQSSAINAKPAGGIEYTYRAEPDANSNTNTTANPAALFIQYAMDILREFMVLFVAGALTVWLVPGWLIRGRDMLSVKPGPSFLWGLVLLITVPIAALFAGMLIFVLGIALGLVTLGGLMFQVWTIGLGAIGLFMGIFGVLATYGSKLVFSLLIGTWLIRLLNKGYLGGIIWPLLLGLVAYIILYSVPVFIGWILSGLIVIFGLGAIWLVFQDWYLSRRKQPAA